MRFRPYLRLTCSRLLLILRATAATEGRWPASSSSPTARSRLEAVRVVLARWVRYAPTCRGVRLPSIHHGFSGAIGGLHRCLRTGGLVSSLNEPRVPTDPVLHSVGAPAAAGT